MFDGEGNKRATALKAKPGVDNGSVTITKSSSIDVVDPKYAESNVDAMRARAGKLRKSILTQQMELRDMERRIMCCSQGIDVVEYDDKSDVEFVQVVTKQALTTFWSSLRVLYRKLARVYNGPGEGDAVAESERWESVGDFVYNQTFTGARIVKNLFENPDSLRRLVDSQTPTLVPHAPAILARLDRLESHVGPILARVLEQRYLADIEPYLEDILERFDDIEPHLPWILGNIEVLAPYCGLLLQHIDELLLYADVDKEERARLGASDDDDDHRYDLAEQLLPYLEFYVQRLDTIGPHLPLLRPHVPALLRHDRIGKISPHVERLFSGGYDDLSASANMDVLLFWFGWALRVPGLPRFFFAVPGSPRMVSFLANRLPKRFVRGACTGVTCDLGGDYGYRWNRFESDGRRSRRKR